MSPPVDKNGPSFVWTLYQQGKLTVPEATFWMNLDSIALSSVTLGGTPAGATKSEYIEQSLVATYNSWWTMKLADCKVGDTSIIGTTKHAISDTGTSLLYLAESDYSGFQQMVMAASPDFTCTSPFYDFCYTNLNTCDVYYAKLKPVTLVLEANEYTISPEGYALSNGSLGGHKCSLAVSWVQDSMGLYILGDTFLRNFVTSYDYKNRKIKMAINTHAPAGVIAVSNPTDLNSMYLIGGVAAAIILAYCCCRKKEDKSKFIQTNKTVLSSEY